MVSDDRTQLEQHLYSADAFLTNRAIHVPYEHDGLEEHQSLTDTWLQYGDSLCAHGFHNILSVLLDLAKSLDCMKVSKEVGQVLRHGVLDVTWRQERVIRPLKFVDLQLLTGIALHDDRGVLFDDFLSWSLFWGGW